jgi:hypothetical protein
MPFGLAQKIRSAHHEFCHSCCSTLLLTFVIIGCRCLFGQSRQNLLIFADVTWAWQAMFVDVRVAQEQSWGQFHVAIRNNHLLRPSCQLTSSVVLTSLCVSVGDVCGLRVGTGAGRGLLPAVRRHQSRGREAGVHRSHPGDCGLAGLETLEG